MDVSLKFTHALIGICMFGCLSSVKLVSLLTEYHNLHFGSLVHLGSAFLHVDNFLSSHTEC